MRPLVLHHSFDECNDKQHLLQIYLYYVDFLGIVASSASIKMWFYRKRRGHMARDESAAKSKSFEYLTLSNLLEFDNQYGDFLC